MTRLSYAGWSRDLPCQFPDGVVVEPDSRFFTLENQRIVGDVVIGRGCSHFTLRNLRIEGGCLRIEPLCFHGLIENVWIDGAPYHGVYVGGYGPRDICNGLIFRTVFARQAAAWGWLVVAQSGLVMEACSADQCGSGGFLFNAVQGSLISLTAESNFGTGIHLYDSHGWCLSPFVAPRDGVTTDARIIVNGGSQIKGL